MKCQQCGYILPDDSLFCQYCGIKIESSSEQDNKEYNKKLDEAYSRYNSELISTLVPGGIDQIMRITTSLCNILKIDKTKCNSDDFSELISIYIEILLYEVRLLDVGLTNEEAQANIISKHSKWLNTDNTVQVADYVQISMQNSNYIAEKDDACSEMLSEYYNYAQKTIEDNDALDKNKVSSAGLSSDNPIYTNGVNGSYRFLDSLSTENGEKLKWERFGSIYNENANGLIDVYKAFSESGAEYRTLYLNMYSNNTPNQCPSGYSFSKISKKPKASHEEVVKQNKKTNHFVYIIGAALIIAIAGFVVWEVNYNSKGGKQALASNERVSTESEVLQHGTFETPGHLSITPSPERTPLSKSDFREVKNAAGYLDADYNYLYYEPNMQSKTVALYKRGTKLTIIAENDVWYRVRIYTDYGYIKKIYVKIGAYANQNETLQAGTKKGYIDADSVNLRAGPTTDSKILGEFFRNTALEIIAEEGEWYKVEIDGKSGYMKSSFIALY